MNQIEKEKSEKCKVKIKQTKPLAIKVTLWKVSKIVACSLEFESKIIV